MYEFLYFINEFLLFSIYQIYIFKLTLNDYSLDGDNFYVKCKYLP